MGRKFVVSHFALEAIAEWCSTEVVVPQKAILKCGFSEPLIKIFEK